METLYRELIEGSGGIFDYHDGYMHKGSMYGQAVGLWYTREPELRKELVARYGVTAPELPWSRQIKHGLRTLVIDKGAVGQTMTWFPRQMHFFSSNDRIAIALM